MQGVGAAYEWVGVTYSNTQTGCLAVRTVADVRSACHLGLAAVEMLHKAGEV